MDYQTRMEKELGQIADMLMLNGTLTECPGLVHGKMGVAVFFFHYAQYTGNELFADYAMDLIGEMMNQIHVNSPADYEKGIAGIGVGIDYLIHNKFLDTEDDICSDLDDRIFRAVMYEPWQDFSLYNGLTGFGRYWITRLQYQMPSAQARECLTSIIELIKNNLPKISSIEQNDIFCFLHDLQNVSAGLDVEARDALPIQDSVMNLGLQLTDVSTGFPRLGDSVVGNMIRMYQCMRYINDGSHDEMRIALKQIPVLDMENPPSGSGLLSGYAGEGMLRLTSINQSDISWMQLL